MPTWTCYAGTAWVKSGSAVDGRAALVPGSFVNPSSTTLYAVSAVAIGPFHGKGVRQVPYLPHRAVLQEHLHNVEAKLHERIVQQAQVIERGPGESPPPLRIHRRRRTDPLLRRARLHLDKHQAVHVSEDEVDLAPRRAEVGGEKLQP